MFPFSVPQANKVPNLLIATDIVVFNLKDKNFCSEFDVYILIIY